MAMQAGIPKAEIHVHIEGTAHPDLVRRLAAHKGIDLSGLFAADGTYSWHDFTSFLRAYDRASSVFASEDACCQLALDYARRVAAEGAIYLECFASPDHAADAGLSYRAYIDGLDGGFRQAEQETGLVARIIVIGVRHRGPEAVERAALLAAGDPHARVSGFGLAGDERSGTFADFRRAFAIAAEAGLGLTAHAGEFGGPDSVRDALDTLRLTRIGHGVRAIEDPALVRRLAEEAVTLECCPGSNIALGLYPDRASHPLARLCAAGVAVTLNSDDPPFFHTSIGREYDAAAAEAGLSHARLLRMTETAVQAAFVDAETRADLLSKLDRYAA